MEAPMEIDISGHNDCATLVVKENALDLYAVSAGESGEGLPYAPENWPNPGDIWTWRVGKRVNSYGWFLDRYLYPPSHLNRRGERKQNIFASKLSLGHYVRSNFPDVDVQDFFNSFSWKIPSEQLVDKTVLGHSGHCVQPETVGCKAGNSACSSLAESGNTSSEFMPCNYCCIEKGFCRDCCCILCCKIATSAYGGYGYIKCEAIVDGEYICGHIAHIDCGLRAYMAGTVGGSIGLDAEYYCRRCDSRTNLVLHVMKLVQTCKTIDSVDNVENILSIGIRLLRDSHKPSARKLRHQIELARAQLKGGANLKDIWGEEDNLLLTAGDDMSALRSMNEETPQDTNITPQVALDFTPQVALDSRFHRQIDLAKLEEEVFQILLSLRKSQVYEYNLAEEHLVAQKNHIQNLYERLEEARSSLSKQQESVDYEALRDTFMATVQQIKQELIKFKEMKEVSKGFGRTSKEILKRHFHLEVE